MKNEQFCALKGRQTASFSKLSFNFTVSIFLKFLLVPEHKMTFTSIAIKLEGTNFLKIKEEQNSLLISHNSKEHCLNKKGSKVHVQ